MSPPPVEDGTVDDGSPVTTRQSAEEEPSAAGDPSEKAASEAGSPDPAEAGDGPGASGASRRDVEEPQVDEAGAQAAEEVASPSDATPDITTTDADPQTASSAPEHSTATSGASAQEDTPPKRLARIIAIANQKGGVGKSTTAVNLGAALAELEHRVLVVDLDPQGNASTGLGIEQARRETGTYEVVSSGVSASSAIVETGIPNLSAIPSTIDLAGAEIELVGQLSREMRLSRALGEVAPDYDFIILDCPPSLGLLTVNALSAAHELIVPIQCEYYALEGLGQLLRNVRLIQQNLNPTLSLTGIVLTMYDSRTKLSEQVVAEVKRYFGPRVYETVVPRTIRLSEAPGFGRPITEYDTKSRGADAYRRLALEVLEREVPDAPLPEDEPPPVVGVRQEGGESA